MENVFQNPDGSLWVISDAFQPVQFSCRISCPNKWHPLQFFECFCFRLPWWYSNLLQRHRDSPQTRLLGPQHLLENCLFVKAEKCEFHRSSISFLAYILESGLVWPDSERIKAVMDWPTPSSCKQLQRFLEFANFYRCSLEITARSQLR